MVPLLLWLRNLQLKPAKMEISNFTQQEILLATRGVIWENLYISGSRTLLGAEGCPEAHEPKLAVPHPGAEHLFHESSIP